jgi:copper(I)-binding protein
MFASRFAAAVVGLVAIAASPGFAQAQDYRLGALTISHPWVRPTPPGAPTAAGYLTITNHGATPDSLLGGSSDELRGIEVHQMSMTGNVMRMRPIAGGLAIAAGQSVMLTPGGDRHLMLIAPKRPLRAGDRVPATLRFEKAGQVNVTFLVHEVGIPMKQPMAMHTMDTH